MRYSCAVDHRRDRLRALPKIDELLRREDIARVDAPRWAVVQALRHEVDALRQAILDGTSDAVTVTADSVEQLAQALCRPSLRQVVNATGVVLHTNLGRAPLSRAVLDRVTEVAAGYSNLEYDLEAGRRGSRHVHVRDAIRDLCGAEDALVVNNNAGAVLVALAALAAGREVVVSRGELIEIGGAFRIPDVMAASGAVLREVGTTNKTRIGDYKGAINEHTAVLLKVHPSNYRIIGFTEEAPLSDVVRLGQARGIATMMDLGSGALIAGAEAARMGLPGEPGVAEILATGVDLVTFSGDKLLGGPQAGILAGSAGAVATIAKHPLMRALRPDKLSLAALEATLAMVRDGRVAEIPAIRMLAESASQVKARAEKLARLVEPAPPWLTISVVEHASAAGGGACPGETLPSWAVALQPLSESRISATDIDAIFRSQAVPVVATITDGQVILDMRTVADSEIELAAIAIRAAVDQRADLR